MRPPCELVVRDILPAFRSLIAKKLIKKHNLSQVAAAEKLSTTQAAISQYLGSKRGDRMLKELESMPEIESTASKMAEAIAIGRFSPIEAIVTFCKLCASIRMEESICSLHRDFSSVPLGCSICLKPER